jgi:hypothetical protein
MVESEETVKQDYITVSGSTEFEDDDAALEAFVQLKELTFGETFDERDTTIDSDDSEGISIVFYHTENNDQLRVYTTEDGQVNIRCTLFGDSVLDAQGILETIKGELDEITMSSVTATKYIEIAFDSLEFPIQSETEYNVTGIRITEPEANYIAQETDEQGVLFINRDRRLNEDGKLSTVAPLGGSDQSAIDEFIDKFA